MTFRSEFCDTHFHDWGGGEKQNLSKFSQVELQITRFKELFKKLILEGFLQNWKMSQRSSYRIPDHFLRPYMILKVSISILGQVPSNGTQQGQAWRSYIRKTGEQSSSPPQGEHPLVFQKSKKSVVKNSVKITESRVLRLIFHTHTDSKSKIVTSKICHCYSNLFFDKNVVISGVR